MIIPCYLKIQMSISKSNLAANVVLRQFNHIKTYNESNFKQLGMYTV